MSRFDLSDQKESKRSNSNENRLSGKSLKFKDPEQAFIRKTDILNLNFEKFFIKIEKDILQGLLKKIVKSYYLKNLLQRKIIKDPSELDTERWLSDLNRTGKKSLDKCEAWVRWNITERTEVQEQKKKLYEREQRIQNKYKKINNLIERISTKKLQEKESAVIERYIKYRKSKIRPFKPNPDVEKSILQIDKVLKRKPTRAQCCLSNLQVQVEQFQKEQKRHAKYDFSGLKGRS